MLRPRASQLLTRLSWVRQTPLGDPVEPEVYWISARSSGALDTGSTSVPPPAACPAYTTPGSKSEDFSRSRNAPICSRYISSMTIA